MSALPEVSVVAPLYGSHGTLAGFLDALSRQTFRDFEVVLVDSSPGEESARIVSARDEPLVYLRSRERLLPQAARGLGVTRARGRLLVFTDPDVYAEPDWLERLVAARRETGHVVVGALACHGTRWLDRGIHLTKFSKWLPGTAPHPVDMGPTANLLVPRELFERVGGFRGDMLMGDDTLSRDLVASGATLWLETRAVVAHHHLETAAGFLRERFRRGRLFGALRMEHLGGGRGVALLFLAATALPVRLASNLGHAAWHAARTANGASYVATFPVVFAGFSAWLFGEAVAYARALSPSAPRGSVSS